MKYDFDAIIPDATHILAMGARHQDALAGLDVTPALLARLEATGKTGK